MACNALRMHPLRRRLPLVLAIVCATTLFACGEEASDKQVETLSGAGFTVQMPGKPERSNQTVQTAAGPIVVTAYITEGGEEGFSMSVAKIPSGVKGDLDGAVEGAATNVKGTPKDTIKTTHQGFPARDTRIINAQDPDGNKGTVFARVILAKGTLFQLQYVTEGGDVKSPPSAYPTFLKSLKIS